MTDPWVAFVSARIADDEQHAAEQHRLGCATLQGRYAPLQCDCGVPDSIRGWCATGRHILGLHQAYMAQGVASISAAVALKLVIQEMARNYRHHPDYPEADG